MNSPSLKLARAPASRRAFILAALAAPFLGACGGGGGSGSGPLPTPARGSFTRLDGTFAASQHSATPVAGGAVLLIGGSRGEPTLSAGIDRFETQTLSIHRVGTLDAGRCAHRATLLSSGDVLISGGLRSSGDPRQLERVSPNGAVTNAGSLSVTRIDHGAVRLADGRVLLTGGFSTGERAPMGISDSAEIWDPATQTVRRIAQRMSCARAAHTATLLDNGKVLLAGGFSWGGGYRLAELFDPVTETFTPLAGDNTIRANHAAHRLADGRVLLLGGESVAADGMTTTPLASCLSLPAGASALVAEASLAVPRTMCDSVLAATGEVLLFGGQQVMSDYTATVDGYLRSRGGETLRALDGERALHTATLLPDGRVLLAGGEDKRGNFRTSVLLYTA